MSHDGHSRQSETVAETFHRAVCAGCGESPDGDGSEYAATPEKAVAIALRELEFVRAEDGRLLCGACSYTDDDYDRTDGHA